MDRRGPLTKILASLGTLLVWAPLLLPVFFAAIRLVQGGRLMLDYLMPAEFFPVALLGGSLLAWASLRVRSRLRAIIGGMVASIVFLGLVMGTAAATGLASGETAPGGWQWTLTLVFLGAFILSMLITAASGILLLGDLFRSPRQGILRPQV